MYKHLLICNIFFIFFIRGKTIPPTDTATKTTLPTALAQSEKKDNTTQYVISEGGSVPSSSPVTLPNNGNYINLINLEKEMSAYKQTSVVARKGVNSQDAKNHDEIMANINSSVKFNQRNKSLAEQTHTVISNASANDVEQKINDTKIRKPLFVSSEALAKTDQTNKVVIDESSPIIKANVVKTGGHPEMIMPVVITILVVPVFAVVGYMVLNRGREAWKNRHYKRMDFLLDGMYND